LQTGPARLLFLLFVLFDVPVQVLLLSPVLLWLLAPPAWHGVVIALGMLLWGGLAIILGRRFRRAWREQSAGELPQGDWRWRPGMTARDYNAQVRQFLHNFGWKALVTETIETDAVTLAMQKDRLRVVVRCRRDVAPPTAAEIAELAALKASHKAEFACLMLPRRAPANAIAAAAAHGVHILKLEKLPMIGGVAELSGTT
jgi:hypothetical protein